MASLKRKLVLGSIVIAASFGVAWWSKQQRIHTIDTTTPDVFGDAVVRES